MQQLEKTGTDAGFALETLSAKAASVGKQVRNTGKYTFSIETGNHAGASLTLEPGTYVIGSDRDCEIVLFADDVAAKHAELSLPSSLLGKARLSPLEKNITTSDGTIVDVGQYVDLNRNETFDLKGTEIRLERIGTPEKFVKPGIRLISVVALLFLIGLSYSVLSNMMVGAVNAGTTTIGAISNVIKENNPIALVTDKDQGPASDAYLWTVRTQLEELGLHYRLRVSQSGTDAPIRITGNISDSELPRWTSFLQWYDQKTTFPPLIRNVSRGKGPADLPKIKSVWLDDEPTVYFQNGKRAQVGSKLAGGWIVMSIDEVSVVLERDGAQVSLTY